MAEQSNQNGRKASAGNRDADPQGEKPEETPGIARDDKLNEAARNAQPLSPYWAKQDRAVSGLKSRHRQRAFSRSKTGNTQTWKRVTHTLPRAEAQQKAREFLKKYPKAAYWSEVESWRELPGDIIEFTMRRLPTAD